MKKTNTHALVLSGGGARGAYEAGVIHFIRTGLPKPYNQKPFPIHCGCSVGAINNVFMASTTNDKIYQANTLYKIWSNLTSDQIYRKDFSAFSKLIFQSLKGILIPVVGSKKVKNDFPGLLDTSPFWPFLKKHINWNQLNTNFKNGSLKAVSVVATNLWSGNPELFLQSSQSVKYIGDYQTHLVRLSPRHLAASAAIPIAFPHVKINKIPFVDGGLRLNTPLSPAVSLGANRILVIGTKAPDSHRSPKEIKEKKDVSLGQILGRLLNTIFLDRLQYDLDQMNRINRLIHWLEKFQGEDFLGKFNHWLQTEETNSNIRRRGLKKVDTFFIQPSTSISQLYFETSQGSFFKHPSLYERFLGKILDIRTLSASDLLSYLNFEPIYLKKLLDLGYEDAKSKQDELMEFLED